MLDVLVRRRLAASLGVEHARVGEVAEVPVGVRVASLMQGVEVLLLALDNFYVHRARYASS